MSHWSDRYSGAAWEAGAEGPEAYDCWGLVRAVLRDQYGIELPAVPHVDRDDVREIVREFAGHPERVNWAPVTRPRGGDVVELSHSRIPHHVGVWVDADGGGVLHAVEGSGVVFSTPSALATNGWNAIRFSRRNARG
jgi:cell wall-associated NlpC family hydrolase